jgi:hypothetical protein
LHGTGQGSGIINNFLECCRSTLETLSQLQGTGQGSGIINNFLECCRSTLETLSQLHGTGLAFKRSVGGHKEILKLFPELEEQIQIKVTVC